MKKFSQYVPEVIQDSTLKKLCEEVLHVGIDGPIEPLLTGKLTIEGTEQLIEALQVYVDKSVNEKIRVLLEEAKHKATTGDLRWFDQKIKDSYDTI